MAEGRNIVSDGRDFDHGGAMGVLRSAWPWAGVVLIVAAYIFVVVF